MSRNNQYQFKFKRERPYAQQKQSTRSYSRLRATKKPYAQLSEQNPQADDALSELDHWIAVLLLVALWGLGGKICMWLFAGGAL